MRGSGSSRSGSGAALGFRGECYRRVRLRSATWPAVPTVPAYIRMQVGTAARYVWTHPRAGSVRQMGRDQRRRRPDRGRRLQGEASPGEIEMVAAEGIHVAVIEAPRSQSEDEQDRRPVLQETRQGGGVRRFLRIRSARVTIASPSWGGNPRFGNSNVWKRPRCANSRRYFPASPMLVVPDTQAATLSGVLSSFSNGNPNVARFASNARAIGAARAIDRRWASARRTGSYEL